MYRETKDGYAEVVSLSHLNNQVVPLLEDELIPVGSYAESEWINTEGFGTVAFTMMSDIEVDSYIEIHWSHDGIHYHGSTPNVLPSGIGIRKTAITPTYARYFKLAISNADDKDATFDGHAYLKVM